MKPASGWRALLIAAAALAVGPSSAAESWCNRPADFDAAIAERDREKGKLSIRDVDYLEDRYAGLIAAYEKGLVLSSEVEFRMSVFDDSAARLTPMFKAWMNAYPKSYAARLAYARHLYKRGFDKRGKAFAGDTKDEQFEGLQEDLGQAAKVLDEAEPLSLKPLHVYAMRIAIARSLGAPRKEIDRLLFAADRIDPLNYSARVEYMHALAPKWGRAEEGEQERYRKELLASDLPLDLKNDLDYRALRFQANDYVIPPAPAERMGRGIKLYDEADRICSAYSENGDLVISFYAKTGQVEAALDYLGRYLVKNPTDGWGFVQRGAILYKLGRIDESFADYKRAHEMGNPRGTYGFGWFYEEGKVVPKDLGKALDLYEQAARRDLPDGRTGAARVRKLLDKPKESP